jgi:WD40 repeat protein
VSVSIRIGSDPAAWGHGLEKTQEADIAEIAIRRKKHGEAFYVVGGPVQPRRGCYVERTADRRLLETLLDGEYCYILSPQQTGKSSLVAKTAGRLRRQGFLTAAVDLSQTVSRDRTAEAGRWYYGIAYRIVRDLRLSIDLQLWWQEKKPLSPLQRLNEFFWEIVLAETRAPVVIFLDEIDAVDHLEYAADLFVSVRSCHDARASEPDYERLRFVLLGTALPVDVPGGGSSLYDIGRRIDLCDFTFQETRPLCNELGQEPGDAERTLYRILYWTGGQPYLTQKLCRAVARSSAGAESDEVVDRLVKSRFLVGNAPFNEPNLRGMRNLLARRDKLAQAALRTYRRVRRGRKIYYDPHDPQHEFLRISGLAKITDERLLVIRNRIYAQVFSARWISQTVPFNWRSTGAIASTLLLLIGIPYWYARLLPRPYVETLKSDTASFEKASDAYRGLHRIPGFATTADELFAVVLERRSLDAREWDEALAADMDLRALEGYVMVADELLSGFWDRRASDAEVVEMRDRALIYRLRALEQPSPKRNRRMAALLGEDYRSLLTVLRPDAPIDELGIDASGEVVVTLRDGHVVNTWSADTGLPVHGSGGFEALAEEFVTTRRRIRIDTPGRVGTLRLTVSLNHPQPTDLKLRLISPSGRSAELPILRPNPDQDEPFVFNANSEKVLAAFMREDATGVWTLEVEDQQSGTTGSLESWELRVSARAGHTLKDTPGSPLPISDPRPSSNVHVMLSPDGRRAAAVSANPEARGYLQIWDVNAGTVTARVPVDAGSRVMAFDSEGLYIVTGGSGDGGDLHVWRVAAGQELLTLQPKKMFVSDPALSVTGSFVAIADGDGQSNTKIRLWDLVAGEEIDGPTVTGAIKDMAVGPGGQWLAVLDDKKAVRVWARGAHQVHRLMRHDLDVERVLFDPSGRWVLTVDSDRTARIWDLRTVADTTTDPIVIRESWDPASISFDSRGDRVLLHSRARSFQVVSLPDGSSLLGPLRHSGEWSQTESTGRTSGLMSRVFSADGSRLVTGLGGRSARTWNLGERVAEVDGADQPSVEQVDTVVSSQPSAMAFAVNPVEDQFVIGDASGALRFGNRSQAPAGEASGEQPGSRFGSVQAMAFSADGRRLVSVDADGGVELWDAAIQSVTGEKFRHDSGRVRSVAVSGSAGIVLTGGEFGARLWDGLTGEPGYVLEAGKAIIAVSMSADGETAVSASESGDIRIWNVGTGEEIWAVTVPDPITALALRNDGTGLATGTTDGGIRLWDVSGAQGRPLSFAVNGSILTMAYNENGDRLLVQTGEWMHLLGAGEGEPAVIASQLLPGIVPAGAWRFETVDGTEISALVENRSREFQLEYLDLDSPRVDVTKRARPGDADKWLEKFKLRFDVSGSLVSQASGDDARIPTTAPSARTPSQIHTKQTPHTPDQANAKESEDKSAGKEN